MYFSDMYSDSQMSEEVREDDMFGERALEVLCSGRSSWKL